MKLVNIFVGAHDGLTARLASRAGIGGVWISGLEISTSYGVPDESILSWRDFHDRARMIKQAVGPDYPIIADIDTGFGGPEQAVYVARQYSDLDISVCVEDKVFPKINSLKPPTDDIGYFTKNKMKFMHKQLPIGDMTYKLMKMYNQTEDNKIYARIESLVANQGVEDAIERAHAYDEVSNGIVIHDNSSTADRIIEFLNKYRGENNITIIPTSYGHSIPNWSDFLNDYPVIENVVFANQGMRMMIDAYEKLYEEIGYNGAEYFTTKSNDNSMLNKYDCGMKQLFSYGQRMYDE